MSDTTIEWATKVWNPLRGCSKVSDGCKNCYAIKEANRHSGPGRPYEGLVTKVSGKPNWTGLVRWVSSKLLEPLYWRKNERIFMNSMSDIFHENVSDSHLDEMFGVVLACYVLEGKQSHTFMSLTKRPQRMREYFSVDPTTLIMRWAEAMDSVVHLDDPDVLFSEYVNTFAIGEIFPLPNYWPGTSVENQKAADERIPLLLQTPAAVRFLSCEPLLGPVDLMDAKAVEIETVGHPLVSHAVGKVDWVIAGGESGPGARPMHPDWVRELRDQCQAAGVAFHFKQWGEWSTDLDDYSGPPFKPDRIRWITEDGNVKPIGEGEKPKDGILIYRTGKKKTGRLLEGRTWDEFPEVVAACSPNS